MAGDAPYVSLEFTEVFLEDLISQNFSTSDRRRFIRALRLLDSDERHPSLRVHELQGSLVGIWSASVSDQLRMTFERQSNGRKIMLTCSRHYAP